MQNLNTIDSTLQRITLIDKLENALHPHMIGQQLIAVDASLPASDVLLQDLAPQQSVLRVGRDEDAIAAITHKLVKLAQNNVAAESLVILAHGKPGEVLIGKEGISTQQLKSRAEDLQRWNLQGIQLFSCHTGAAGHFVETLERLSGATVFASEKTVGHQSLGGAGCWRVRKAL